MKKFFLLPLLLIFSMHIYAEPVNEELARKAALNFMQHYSRLKSGVTGVSFGNPSSFNSTTTYYTFTVNGGGWILISADDAATPVLAYSTSGDWNEETMSPAAKMWIESYSKEIYEAIQNRQSNEASKIQWQELLDHQFSDAVITVAPLLSTQWDQSRYYNDLCPASGSAPYGYGGHVPAGCVATTMAQIMNYHKYPAQGIGSYSYTHPTYGTLSSNFGSTDYNWSTMPNKASSPNSALATLIFHCGVAVGMNYKPDGSGASSEDVSFAMKSYFNYDNNMKLLSRESIASDELWRTIIRTELEAGRPVYYAGSGTAGGHAFVCDGYDSSNPTKFHINWGWSGNSDGYFSIGALTTSNGAFNDFNRIIVGIKPRPNPDYICRIENPAYGAEINSGSVISITTKAVKGNTTKVVLYLDGVKKDSCTSTPFSFTLNTSLLSAGPHTISVKATDGTSWDYHESGFNMLSSCWQLQNITFSTDSVEIAQICAVDDNVIWAVLKDYSSKNLNLKKYIKTVNGGASWIESTIDCPTCNTLDISNIHALSASKAYASLNPGTASGGAILYTENGGTNWTVQSTADFTGSWANWVYFFDESNGVCMGDSYKPLLGTSYNFCIYTTSNGGITWNKVNSNLPVALANEAGTVNFYDAVGNLIWFGTNNGRIYKSVDKGLSWTVKDNVLAAVQTNVKFKDINNGIAFGGFGTAEFGFKKTTDGGANWTQSYPYGAVSGQDYEYVPGTGSTWINSGYYSSVSVTDNSTYYWLDYNTNISTTKFLSPSKGWGGGYYSVKNGGGIYKWVGNLTPSINSKIVLRVKNSSGNPVPDATAVFNFQVKPTTDKGLATYDVISFGNPVSFKISKSGYSTYNANYYVSGEDTVDIILASTQSVIFTVKNTSGAAISGATVIFNGISMVTGANGIVTFQNVAKGLSNPYAVTKTTFYAGYGMINVTDATITQNVTLISEATGIKTSEKVQHLIFPNPAAEILNVMSENPITGIEIISMSGKVVYSNTYNSNTVQISLSEVKEGEYVVKVIQGKKQESQKLMVKHPN